MARYLRAATDDTVWQTVDGKPIPYLASVPLAAVRTATSARGAPSRVCGFASCPQVQNKRVTSFYMSGT